MGWIKNRIDAEFRKHKRLDWSRIAEAKIITSILDWCYKNNTIPMKDLHPELKDSKLKLATTDGGWVNVLKLQDMLK